MEEKNVYEPESGISMCVMDFDLADFYRNRVVPLDARITALKAEIESGAHDGRSLELKKGLFPDAPDTPDDDAHRAILWRVVAKTGEAVKEWNLLVYMHEIKGDPGLDGEAGPPGPEGPKGQDGQDGKGITIRGTVATTEDLIKLTVAGINGCYMVLDTLHVWMFVGPSTAATSDWANWKDLGPLTAQKGDKGDQGPRGLTGPRGPRGDRGPKGSDGSSVSSFLVQWMVNSATSAAISGMMIEISSAINDAIELMASQLATMAENAATAAVNKAVEDLMDQFKGDKGEKGDKGDKGDNGKDGKSVRMVGRYDTLSTFMTRWPAVEANVGVAALIGAEADANKVLWAITQSGPSGGPLPPHITYEELGDIRGPAGEAGKDAEWNVSIRDTHFVEKANIEVVSGLPAGVAGMYIQDSDSIVVTGLTGSEVSPDQVGFRINMKYPIPTLIPEGSVIGTPTVDKFLTNNGTRLEWADVGLFNEPKDKLLLQAPNKSVYALTVSNDGRLSVTLEPTTP